MVFHRKSLTVLSLGLGAWLAMYLTVVATTRADVVLMHNGSLLEGETRQENGAVFVTGPGSEVRLREADVATVVGSSREAYQWLRDRRDADSRTAGDYLSLAEWCLRQGMWREASLELIDARRLAPHSERVAMIERRLRLLTQEPPAKRHRVVQLTSAEESVKTLNEYTDAEPVVLPQGGLKYFTRRIQPLLVNNCTTSGCHVGDSAGQFELDRRLLHGYANARSTQHNLRSILAAIDTENPLESPLLTAARGPHQDVMPFHGNRRDEWLARIEAWITAVAAAQPKTKTPSEPMESKVIQASHEEPIKEEITADVVEKLRPAKLTVGGTLTTIKPRDEFDPEIFNREYRRSKDDLTSAPAGP